MSKLNLLILCALVTCVLCTSSPDARTVTFTFEDGTSRELTISSDSNIKDIFISAPELSTIGTIWDYACFAVYIVSFAFGVGIILAQLAVVAVIIGAFLWVIYGKK